MKLNNYRITTSKFKNGNPEQPSIMGFNPDKNTTQVIQHIFDLHGVNNVTLIENLSVEPIEVIYNAPASV